MVYNTLLVHFFSPALIVTIYAIFVKLANAIALEKPINCVKNSSNSLQNKGPPPSTDTTFSNYVILNSVYDDINKETYETVGYPYKKISEAIHTLNIGTYMKYSSSGIQTYSTTMVKSRGEDLGEKERVGNALRGSGVDSDIAKPTCKVVHHRVRPLTGTATDGNEYYIVNIKGVVQIEELIKCYKRDEPCGDKSKTPENYAYGCRQQEAEVYLLSYSDRESDITKAIFNTSYRIAHGCSCEMYRISI